MLLLNFLEMDYFLYPAKSTPSQPSEWASVQHSPPECFYLRVPLPGLALRTLFCHPHQIAIVFNLLFPNDHRGRYSTEGVYSARL